MPTQHDNPQLPALSPAPVLAPAQDKSFHPFGALLLHSLPQAVLLALWGWMLVSFASALPETAKPFYYLSFGTMLIVWLVNLGAILYHFLAGIQLSYTHPQRSRLAPLPPHRSPGAAGVSLHRRAKPQDRL